MSHSRASVILMQGGAGNREALLQGAIRCLEERGYARTTARDLVAASGTNLGAIGYHFGSKEALLNEALAECVRRWIARLEELPARSAQAWLRDSTRLLFELLSENRPIAVAYLEAWAQAERSPRLREQLAGHYREFRAATAALADAVATQAPGKGGPDGPAIASLLIALVDGLTVQWLLDPDGLPDGERLIDAVSALTPLLRP